MFEIREQPISELIPGEQATLKISFHPTGLAGQKRATLTIITNDLVTETFTLILKGDCIVIQESAAPTVTITSTSTDPTGSSPIPVRITFSEPVNGFTASDIQVSGGTKGPFQSTDSNSFVISILPTADGTVTVDVPADAVQSVSSGVGNAAATQFSIRYDGTAPEVAISSTAGDPTNESPIPISITFSEIVAGFTPPDIAVTGGTKGALQTSDNTSFSVNVTPENDPVTVTVDVDAGVATDSAGNANTAQQFSV